VDAVGPEAIAEGIWVFRSRFAEMLSTLIRLDADHAVLVDPPMFADEAEGIRRFARERGLSVDFLVLTHAHGDHIYGAVHFPGTLTLAHRDFWDFWREIEAMDREFFSRFLPDYGIPEVRCPHLLLAHGSRMRFQRELVFAHVPGHSPDGLMVELPGEGIWIAGDTVLPVPLVSSGSLRRLHATLLDLLGRFHGGTIVPGHGEVVRDGTARRLLEGNVRYLERLGEEVGRAISAGKDLREVEGSLPLARFGIREDAVGGLAAWIHRENLRRAYTELSEGE